ncbi:MAG: hypothetical protein INQ03_17740 [Candidatus Heimdallarchaeota archaeon]|nr:hypothetical protein [Candidatus Heimdallarchaeota archaeon]
MKFSKLLIIVLLCSLFPVSAQTTSWDLKPYPELIRDWDNLSLLYSGYHNSSMVYDELKQIESVEPLVDMEVIGNTYQDKPIYALRITNELKDYQKAKALIVAQHHGREQITIEDSLRLILDLINNYGVDDEITSYLDSVELYIIPALNLDALDLVIEGNHWLRKNLHPYDNDGDGKFDEDGPEDVNGDGKISCFDVYEKEGDSQEYLPSSYECTYFEGIDNDGDGLINEDHPGFTDLNRNYPVDRDYGELVDTQSQVYAGPDAFSEPETQAFRDFAMQHYFAMAYSLHSGINATYFPVNYGYWPEPQLYNSIGSDLWSMLPPNYQDPNNIPKYHTYGPGHWESWMYIERRTLVPITFEVYRNASSVANTAFVVKEDNDTHYIEEWTEIYGYFAPDSKFLDLHYQTIRDALLYILELTPRLDIVSENTGLLSITNLSPRISTIDPIYHKNAAEYFDIIQAGTIGTISLESDSETITIGNDFTGYYVLEKSTTVETPHNLSFLVAVLLIPIVRSKRFLK